MSFICASTQSSMVLDMTVSRSASAAALLLFVRHGEGLVDGVGLLVEVEGVDGYGVLSELLVGAGFLGEDQDAVLLVYDDRLLGDEVHAVAHGVHEQDVEVLVGGDGAGETCPP